MCSTNWFLTLVQNSGWMGMAQVARVAEALVRSVIVARALSLEGFAAYAVAFAFVGLITELANLDFGAVILTYGARYRHAGDVDHLKALYKLGYLGTVATALLAGLLIAGILAVFYMSFIAHAGLYSSIVVLGFASAFSLLDTINKSILRMLNRFKVSCIADVGVSIINVAFMFVFFKYVSATPANAIYGSTVCLLFMTATGAIVAWVVLAKTAPGWWSGSISCLAKDTSSMLRMTLGNSLASSMQRLMRKGDVLLLAALAPAEAVGFYDIGKKLSALALLPRDALALAAFPQIGKAIAAGRFDKMRALIIQLFKIGVPASLGIVVLTWALANPIVEFVYGVKYMSAAPVFLILIITSLLYLLFFWWKALLLSTRRVKAQILANGLGLGVMVASGALIVPIWQEIGMAWAAVIGTFAQFLVVAWVAWTVFYSECRSDSEPSSRPDAVDQVKK